MREDQILPHLAALAILLAAEQGTAGDAGAVHITRPADAAELIGQLRDCGAVLICDPDAATIRLGGHDSVAVSTARTY